MLGLTAILLLFLIPVSYGQNTKGDKAQSQRVGKRENKIRSSSKQKGKPKQSYNRVLGRRSSQANRASSRAPKRYSQKGPFVNNKSVTGKIKKQNTRSQAQGSSRSVSGQYSKRSASSPRVQARSATGSTRNVYPQQGRFVNYSSKSGSRGNTYSNRQQLAKTNKASYNPDPPKRRRVAPRSASRSYVSKRSINAFAGFWNKKPKGEKAYVGDISGRKLRTKNFETKKPPLIKSSTSPYYGRKPTGDRPYKGRAGGSHVSASRSGKAWRGDIAGRKIRGRNFTSRKTMEGAGRPIHPPKQSRQRVGDRPYKGSMPGGGYKSVTGKMKKGTGPVPVRTPGIGANGIDTYRGNIRGGKTFTPQGAGYSGNIKSRRPLKGGGSISGKRWNNNGMPIGVRTPGGDAARAATYQGNIRGGKIFSPQGADYSGNIKTKKPLKGGGSVSGKLWNNRGLPVGARPPSNETARAARFQGNLKGGRPLKGGGSVSGKLWNNKQSPIPTRIPPAGAEKVAGYPGGYKLFDLKPSMRNQGEEFTGTIKGRRKPLKGGGSVSGKLWNNKEQPIPGKTPGDTADETDGFLGKTKMKKDYVRNPNSSKEALMKVRPDKTTYLVDGLQIKIKQQNYKKKPNAAENAMPGIAPGKNSIKASEYTKAMKQNWKYKHNPSSADNALDQHEPGKAFARATDYQGNIKMRKVIFGKKGLHPDAQFVKIEKNNTDAERDVLTNFKLWWARVFKKSDTQPDHLKEKYKKPRYDKREEGLWYD
jgi:hypothetical protein